MNSREIVRKLGPNYKPAPERNVFGERPATPVEILRGIEQAKEANKLPEQKDPFQKRRRRR